MVFPYWHCITKGADTPQLSLHSPFNPPATFCSHTGLLSIFVLHTSALWNSLPCEIVSVPSFTAFKCCIQIITYSTSTMLSLYYTLCTFIHLQLDYLLICGSTFNTLYACVVYLRFSGSRGPRRREGKATINKVAELSGGSAEGRCEI